MTENTWIPTALALPDEGEGSDEAKGGGAKGVGVAVDMRFADGEVIPGKYRSGRFSDENGLVWLSGVKEWRSAKEDDAEDAEVDAEADAEVDAEKDSPSDARGELETTDKEEEA